MRYLIHLVAFACLVGAVGDHHPVTAPEYSIKAVFLYNLIKYTEWPSLPARADPTGAIVLAVIGDDPFGNTLDQAVQDRTVRGRHIVVARFAGAKDIKPCHVAFVSGSDSARLTELIHILTAQSVLVVGDSKETARAGAAVNFFMEQGKLRFDVNSPSTQRSHIALSSQLLKLARRVVESGN